MRVCDSTQHALSAGLAPLGQGTLSDFQIARDHHEQIVEIVGDASCQLTDSFHFLSLTEQRLGFLAMLCFGFQHDLRKSKLAWGRHSQKLWNKWPQQQSRNDGGYGRDG